ncbi:unnamed protein product, partial [Closterium sp. Naga37s-1]
QKDEENKRKDAVNKQKDEENKRKDEKNKRKAGGNMRHGGNTRKDGGNTRKDGGNKRKDGGNTRKDGGNTRKDGGNTRKDGGNTRKDGGNTRKDGGNTRKDGGNTRKDGGNTRKDGGNTRKDGGNKMNENRGAVDAGRVQMPAAAFLSPLPSPPLSPPLTLHAPTPLALLSPQGSAWQWLWGEFTCWPACHPPFIGSPHHTTPLSPTSPPNPTAGQRMAVDVGRVQLPACAVDRSWEEELMCTHLFMHESVHVPVPWTAAPSTSARVGLAAVSLKALGPVCYPITTTLHLTLPSPIPACIQERTSARVGREAVSLKALGAHCYPTATTPTPLTRPSVCPSPCCLQECTCGAGSGLSEGPGAPLLCRGGFQSLS